MNTNRINHKKAMEYYNLEKGWVLHHKDPCLINEDPERYHEWRVEDLEPMTKGDHRRLHMKIAVANGDTKKYGRPLSEEHKEKLREYAKRPKSEDHKKKISESNKGKHDMSGSKNPNYGKKHPGIGGRPIGSPATKGSKGMHWWNNGETDVLSLECPEGFVKGRIRGLHLDRDEFGKFC